MRVEDPPEPRVRSAAAIPIGGPATKHRHRKRKRNPWRVAAMLILVAILAGLGGGGLYANSLRREATGLEATLVSDLERGQAELEAGKTSLKQANTTHDEKLIAKAKAHFSAAQLQFRSASQTADKSRLLRELEGLPYVGPGVKTRHSSVDSVANMGVQLSLAGGHLADLDGQLIQPAGSGQEGSSLLKMVGQVQNQISSVTDELKGA